jgi:hypothetical protein
MKDSFVGDINDYRKYDLLEQISKEAKFRILVVWMRTGGDGNRLDYLEQEACFKNYNPRLYEGLKNIINGNKRKLEEVKNLEIFKGKNIDVRFLDQFSNGERVEYFEKVVTKAKTGNFDLVFFDPDIGISQNEKKDAEHIYLDELKKIWDIEKDILVYQSYKHEDHEKQIEELIDLCEKNFDGSRVIPFVSPYMYFSLVTRRKEETFKKVIAHWKEFPEK